jgi:uncharacterized protein
MHDILNLAGSNLLSPPVLFFALGFAASFARSDLEVPQAVAKALSLYLLLAIGFKGGVAVASHGLDAKLISTLAAGIVLSAAIPFLAFALLRIVTNLPRVDAVAVAAHYGSISIVTFAAATSVLVTAGIDYEGYLVAVAAVMETPAIVSALLLLRWSAGKDEQGGNPNSSASELWREIAFNGSIVLLTGAFIIGWVTGQKGLDDIAGFVVDPFKGVLCLFLLDMGLVAGRGMRQGARDLSLPLVDRRRALRRGRRRHRSVGGGRHAAGDACGIGVLYCRAGGDAACHPGSAAEYLSQPVARRHVPV